MDIHLAYTSVAAVGFREDELTRILQHSRTYNATVNITGVLLYVRGSFIQVLEGKRATVEALYERIKKDTRHTNVTMLLNRPIVQRLFPNWAMGYTILTEHESYETQAILTNYNEGSAVRQGNNLMFKMLSLFYETNRRQVD
jgi:Sensors of blue-light using FAD